MSEWIHPAFVRARALPEPMRSYFPKSDTEAQNWIPMVRRRALSARVLAVARARIECAWSTYVDAVPGMNHAEEMAVVLDHGTKMSEQMARLLFPEFAEVPYAD